jgi:hypothetical protein
MLQIMEVEKIPMFNGSTLFKGGIIRDYDHGGPSRPLTVLVQCFHLTAFSAPSTSLSRELSLLPILQPFPSQLPIYRLGPCPSRVKRSLAEVRLCTSLRMLCDTQGSMLKLPASQRSKACRYLQ